MYREHVRLARDECDRDEIFRRVIRKVRKERHVCRSRGAGRHRQRIAIGRRFRAELGAEYAGRAGAVVDDDLLTERLGEPLLYRARDEVRAATGREGDDETNGFGGVRRRLCGRAADLRQGGSDGDPCSVHRLPSCEFRRGSKGRHGVRPFVTYYCLPVYK
jgi:hypothetical protein